MLYFVYKTMIFNRYTHTTNPQQKHNKKQVCCKHSQHLQTLLWICCACNFFFHWKLDLFHNKTTKNQTT